MRTFSVLRRKIKNRNIESSTSKQKTSAFARARVASLKLVCSTGLFRGAAVGLGFRPWIQNFLHLGSNTCFKGMNRCRLNLGVVVYPHCSVCFSPARLTPSHNKLSEELPAR